MYYMVFSNKILNSVYLSDSSDSDDDINILDQNEIDELEKKLQLNYILLLEKHKEIKKKKRDNYLLESLSNKYNEMNDEMKKEKNSLIKYLKLLNKYIEQNKSGDKNIRFLLENEKKNIKEELKKINSI